MNMVNMDIVDWQTSSLVIGVFFALAIIVYLISVFGTLEKSYEEAVEEQRRLSQEIATQSKSDKPKKEKKFKKWGKRTKERGREGEKLPLVENTESNADQDVSDGHPDHIEFKAEPEVILTDSEPELKLNKSKKKGKSVPGKSILVNKGEVQPPSESEESLGESRARGNSFDKIQPKDELELSKFKSEKIERQSSISVETDSSPPLAVPEEKSRDEVMPKSGDSKKPQVDAKECVKQEGPQPVKEEAVLVAHAAPVSASPRKKSKRNKMESFDGGDGLDMSGKKLIEVLKNAALNDEEIQLLINVLLNKQQDGSWTKKNDPVATLKKQLQEKEQALEMEQQNIQTATAKVRELHQELGQEKSRTSALEKKLSLLQQEIQALHARNQHTHDQHVTETQALQAKLQQLQAKRNEDHTATVKRLQEDNNRLQQALSQMEAETQSRNSMEVSRLQHEIEQLLAARDQYEKRQAALQQTADDMHLQVQQLEDHIQQLMTSHQEKTQQLMTSNQDKEYGYQQRLADLTAELQQMKASGTTLMEELLSLKSQHGGLEEDNAMLRKQLDDLKQLADSKANELMHLRSSIDDLQNQRTDLEARCSKLQSQVTELSDKDTEHIKHIQQLHHEKENLMLQIQELTAKVAEIPTKQQNGDIAHQEPQEETVKQSEYEKLLKEKEKVVAELQGEIDKCNEVIATLKEEVKSQQNKNNELREKNWKAMEALESAQKNAEAAEKQRQQSDQLIEQMDTKLEDERKKIVESCEQRIKQAEKEVERLKRLQEQACRDVTKTEEQFRQRVEELQNLVNTLQGKEKELSSRLDQDQKAIKDVMQRIFPSVKFPVCKEHSQWIGMFEKEALRCMEQMKSYSTIGGSEETKSLYTKLEQANEVITNLGGQIQHYKVALSKTESILTKLQSSVEAEEQNWKQKLEVKENELKKALRDQDVLRAEKSKLESSLEQLQGVEEMQSKLIELQGKLQGEENEKRCLMQKVEEATRHADALQEQVKNAQKELEDLRKAKLTIEELRQDLETVRSQLEKEKKITKDLSGQVLKLDSLLKISHEAFKAEDLKVKELQAQLQALKDGTSNGPPQTETNMNSMPPSAQIDSQSGQVKREKRNKSKKRGASGKK